MRMPQWFLVSSIIALAGITTASAGSPAAKNISPPHDILVKVQADLCENWHRECARLWGYGSYNWQQCMGQPAAIADCGGGGRFAQPSGGLCENWHRECARLWGYGSYNWQQCMGQPAAIYDCGGGGGGGRRFAQPSGGLCENWYTECARLHGYRTRAWRQCMRQPAAIWDCQRGR
jgi:hypothetical protein